MTFDLDAARAAVDESRREPWSFTFRGRTFHVVRPLPIGAMIAVLDGDFRLATNLMFGDEAADVLAAGLDMIDLRLIIDEVLGGPGEAVASSGSSEKDGAKSRRTSKPTTK